MNEIELESQGDARNNSVVCAAVKVNLGCTESNATGYQFPQGVAWGVGGVSNWYALALTSRPWVLTQTHLRCRHVLRQV